jgi:hypothetical protein
VSTRGRLSIFQQNIPVSITPLGDARLDVLQKALGYDFDSVINYDRYQIAELADADPGEIKQRLDTSIWLLRHKVSAESFMSSCLQNRYSSITLPAHHEQFFAYSQDLVKKSTRFWKDVGHFNAMLGKSKDLPDRLVRIKHDLKKHGEKMYEKEKVLAEDILGELRSAVPMVGRLEFTFDTNCYKYSTLNIDESDLQRFHDGLSSPIRSLSCFGEEAFSFEQWKKEQLLETHIPLHRLDSFAFRLVKTQFARYRIAKQKIN